MPSSPPGPRTGSVRRERLRSARLYLCTDLRSFLRVPADDTDAGLDLPALEDFYVAAFRGGVDIIQVRDKTVSVRTELAALSLLVAVAARFGGLSAANDRADLALLAGVDVLHLGQEDLGTASARRILGPEIVLGRSCHTPAQVEAAAADDGVDYFCTGPLWPTPTKPGRPAVGLDLPAFAARLPSARPSKPFFAIGGVNAQNLPEVIATGAGRVVVVRAITEAPDPQAAARELSAVLTGASGARG